jgi:hypothetical protein
LASAPIHLGHRGTVHLLTLPSEDQVGRFLRALMNLWTSMSSHPGSAGDNGVINQVPLANRIAALPLGFCVIADAAHTANERIISVCCSGNERLIPRNDDFNFCVSQRLIRVEMAFGLAQMKWGTTLCQPQSCSLKSLVCQVRATARLRSNLQLMSVLGALGGDEVPTRHPELHLVFHPSPKTRMAITFC